jgi:hypothetical protein
MNFGLWVMTWEDVSVCEWKDRRGLCDGVIGCNVDGNDSFVSFLGAIIVLATTLGLKVMLGASAGVYIGYV